MNQIREISIDISSTAVLCPDDGVSTAEPTKITPVTLALLAQPLSTELVV